jgi:hypothetical protein
MLASLISYRPNRKKVSSKSPFSLKRPDPSSPHPYSATVFDIGESSYEEVDPDAASSSRIHDSSLKLPTGDPVHSPRVDIDIDLTPADWFPSHFLKTDSIAGPSSLTGAASAIAASATASKSADTLQTDAASDEEEEDDASTTSEDVVSNLEAMDVRVDLLPFNAHISRAAQASHFVNLPESDGLVPQSTVCSNPSTVILFIDLMNSAFPSESRSIAHQNPERFAARPESAACALLREPIPPRVYVLLRRRVRCVWDHPRPRTDRRFFRPV